MKDKIDELIREIDSGFTGDSNQLLSSLQIDSFDFLSLRAALQESVGLVYSDDNWIQIVTVADFLKLGSRQRLNISTNEHAEVNQERSYQINMPQMATGGLGESWYYKEIGDMHWRLLAKSLGVNTDKILDEAGNRLYATFVRIKYEGSSSFQEFDENEEIKLNLKMSQFGAFFISENHLASEKNKIHSQLVTSFVSRGKNNRDLKKSQPKSVNGSSMLIHNHRPNFLEEYYQLRKGEIKVIELKGHQFKLNSAPIFEMSYDVNPYTDLNGVNLLYFAAYPLIFDMCERKYVQTTEFGKKLKDDWGIVASSVAKDIHYLGNADLHEALIFRLNSFEVKGRNVFSHGSLVRKSDGEVMAQIFSVKKVKEEL